MVDTITLSVPAVDVLAEHLNLNVRQYPFEIPRAANSPEHDRIAARAWEELDATGLVREGRPEPELEDALYLLCSAEVSIAASGLLDVRAGQRLAARIVATGEVGVAGVMTQRGLQMDFMAPDDLPRVSVSLLPDAPAGAGEPVTAPVEQGANSEGLREIAAATALTKHRLGHFVVSSTGRRGKRARLPGLAWFDTDRGRYTLVGERDERAHEVLTCTPVDRDGLSEQIGALLGRARPE